MEFLLEANRFEEMLKTSLIGGELTRFVGYFRPDGLHINDKYLGYFGVKAFYSPRFFMSYKVESEEERVTFTSVMFKLFSRFFQNFVLTDYYDWNLKVFTKDNKLHFENGRTGQVFYKESLLDAVDNRYSIKIPDSEKGFIPVGRPIRAQTLIGIEQLKLPKSEECKFVCNGETIKIEIGEWDCYYSRTLKTKKPTKLSELGLFVSAADLKTITKLFWGEVWLTLYKKAVVLSKKAFESSLTYILMGHS